MKATLSQIGQWISDSHITADAVIDGVSTDSRQVVPGSLFVALKGERFDAHRFLGDVAAAGKAAAVMVEQVPEGYPLPALVVHDTRQAMGEMAACWRRQFDIPVIGVTGRWLSGDGWQFQQRYRRAADGFPAGTFASCRSDRTGHESCRRDRCAGGYRAADRRPGQ